MAKKKTTVSKSPKADIVSAYMDYILNEGIPKSVFSFCKHCHVEEADFYNYFGSIENLKKSIWVDFYLHVEGLLLKNDEYANYNNREKLLTFYFTFFEMLTANRSYVLVALKDEKHALKSLQQLSKLRSKIKDFGSELVEADNENTKFKISKKPAVIISEAVWLQFLFLLKFWLDDDSAGFQKTDIAIEKSVHTVFDVFDNTPLESILDFGKFIWKEKFTH